MARWVLEGCGEEESIHWRGGLRRERGWEEDQAQWRVREEGRLTAGLAEVLATSHMICHLICYLLKLNKPKTIQILQGPPATACPELVPPAIRRTVTDQRGEREVGREERSLREGAAAKPESEREGGREGGREGK